MTSRRQDALATLEARVSQIRISNGYQTEAGARIFIGEEPVLGPHDPESSVAINVRRDEVGHQGENVVLDLPVGVQAIVRADAAEPWKTIEAVIADIKRAVEQDHDLGGTLLRRGLERGSTTPANREAGSVFISAEVEYVLKFAEGWGQP